MSNTLLPDDPNVLLTIQNTSNPAQGIFLVIDESREFLKTQGLKPLFGLKEIRLKTQDVLEDLQQYAQVLAFILDTIATADKLGLPYSYQNEFQFDDVDYTLLEDGEYRSLMKA